MVISAVIVFAGTAWLLHWPLAPAIAFGVLIGPLIPVAIIALFKDFGIKGRVRLLVESESLFNDGVAAVLFALALTIFSGVSPTGIETWFLLVRMAGGGIAAGIVVALAALLVAGRTGDHLVDRRDDGRLVWCLRAGGKSAFLRRPSDGLGRTGLWRCRPTRGRRPSRSFAGGT